MRHAIMNGMIIITITDSLCLTFDGEPPEGESSIALLTARGKDHDLDEDKLITLRDACDAALIVYRTKKRTW
jgi:hypothetical protein